MPRAGTLLLLALTAFLHAAVAGAHAFLDHAVPGVGAVVHSAPAEVRLTFTQRLEPAFSTVEVLDQDAKRVDKADVRVDPANPTVLVVTLSGLASGKYRVKWRVLSVDTHVTEGDYVFEIAP